MTTDESSTYNHKSEFRYGYKSMAGSDFKTRWRYIICIVILAFVCLALIVPLIVVIELYVMPGRCSKKTSTSTLEEDTTTLQEITGTVLRIIKLKLFPVPVRFRPGSDKLKFRRYFIMFCDN